MQYHFRIYPRTVVGRYYLRTQVGGVIYELKLVVLPTDSSW